MPLVSALVGLLCGRYSVVKDRRQLTPVNVTYLEIRDVNEYNAENSSKLLFLDFSSSNPLLARSSVLVLFLFQRQQRGCHIVR